MRQGLGKLSNCFQEKDVPSVLELQLLDPLPSRQDPQLPARLVRVWTGGCLKGVQSHPAGVALK